jgi:hypothetical protein
MGRLRVDKKIFRAPRWLPSPLSIKDRVVLADEQVLIMYGHMRDLWGLVNLVPYVTT